MLLNSIERLGEIMKVLVSDTDRARTLLSTENSPYARRNYIRTFFAMIEGLTFQMKQVALERENQGFVTFSPSEHDQLLEDSRFVRSLDNIRLSFESFARAHGSSFRPNYGDHRWDRLGKGIRIRNGITHPKRLSDLDITDTDVQTLREGIVWYRDTLMELLRQCTLSILGNRGKDLRNSTKP
jgi:hypothetical protein